jgi:hypothetical protein
MNIQTIIPFNWNYYDKKNNIWVEWMREKSMILVTVNRSNTTYALVRIHRNDFHDTADYGGDPHSWIHIFPYSSSPTAVLDMLKEPDIPEGDLAHLKRYVESYGFELKGDSLKNPRKIAIINPHNFG